MTHGNSRGSVFYPFCYLVHGGSDGRIFHELCHYWQLISTGYGLYDIYARIVFSKYVKKLLGIIRKRGIPFAIPLKDMDYRAHPEFEKVKGDAVRALRTFHLYAGCIHPPEPALPADVRKGVCPRVRTGSGMDVPLGGYLIMEGFAAMGDEIREDHAIYGMTRDLVEKACSSRVDLLLPILSDYALMIPAPVERKWPFRQRHPGWRFVDGLNALMRMSLPHHTDPIRAYCCVRECLDAVPRAVPLRAVADSILKQIIVFNDLTPREDGISEISCERYRFWHDVITEAMERRKERPGIFAFPAMHRDELIKAFPPPLTIEEGRMLYSIKEGWIRSHFAMTPLLYQAFTSQQIVCNYRYFRISCPEVDPSRPCPTYPILASGWNRCSFATFVESSGIPTCFNVLPDELITSCSRCFKPE